MFRLEVLPAAQGDALLLEWGDGDSHRLLVDGGPVATYGHLRDRVGSLAAPRHLELLVVTHVDGDHLEGVVRLLLDREELALTVGDVWFNGWPQVERHSGESMGPDQGEMLGAVLQRDGLPWNRAFTGGPVQLPAAGPPPEFVLPGGLTVTVLGPTADQLVLLRKRWTTVLRRSGIVPGHAASALERLRRRPALWGRGREAMGGRGALDSSVANASSVALLLEHEGRRALLTGDGHADVLVAGLRRLLADRGESVLRVDVVKLPHHGSRANVTCALLDLLDCSRFVFSTNGAYHGHPDAEAVERVLARQERTGAPVELLFNYDCPSTAAWRGPRSPAPGTPRAVYAAAGQSLVVDV